MGRTSSLKCVNCTTRQQAVYHHAFGAHSVEYFMSLSSEVCLLQSINDSSIGALVERFHHAALSFTRIIVTIDRRAVSSNQAKLIGSLEKPLTPKSILKAHSLVTTVYYEG